MRIKSRLAAIIKGLFAGKPNFTMKYFEDELKNLLEDKVFPTALSLGTLTTTRTTIDKTIRAIVEVNHRSGTPMFILTIDVMSDDEIQIRVSSANSLMIEQFALALSNINFALKEHSKKIIRIIRFM